MNTLVKVFCSNIGSEKVNSVNARELYKDIGSKQHYTNWIVNRIKKYSFVENKDYIIIETKKDGNNATLKDYIITLDMAKELAMVENNPKGREVREYFIQIEKEYQTKLLKGSQKYKTLLESEKSKTINLSLQLQQCKDKLEATQKEKNYIKSNALLKFQDMELETSKAINQFQSLKLKVLSKDNIPQNIFLDMIDNLFTLLNIHSQILGEDFQ